MFIKNKKSWTRIIEVFVSVFLLATVLSIAISHLQTEPKKSQEIFKMQDFALKVIQLNDSLREDVLENSLSLEINNSFKNSLPFLNCVARICNITDVCPLSQEIKKEIYTASIPITSTLTNQNFRKLKLFCWE